MCADSDLNFNFFCFDSVWIALIWPSRLTGRNKTISYLSIYLSTGCVEYVPFQARALSSLWKIAWICLQHQNSCQHNHYYYSTWSEDSPSDHIRCCRSKNDHTDRYIRMKEGAFLAQLPPLTLHFIVSLIVSPHGKCSGRFAQVCHRVEFSSLR